MSKGRFGIHGGQYIPETLMNAVIELEEAYNHYKDDPEFNAELTELLNEYAGRPSRLYFASHMTEDLGGAKVYLKREDFTFHTHKSCCCCCCHTMLTCACFCNDTGLAHFFCKKYLTKYIVDFVSTCMV